MSKLLDLFCGGGGASRGYELAGFDVCGVDLYSQPQYPNEFIKANALDILKDDNFLDQFDVIHASPPCQAYTRGKSLRDARFANSSGEDLFLTVLCRLIWSKRNYIVENVPGSFSSLHPIVLCGSSFGLKVRRHRLFWSNMNLVNDLPCRHKEQGRPVGVYYNMADNIPDGGRTAVSIQEAQEAMGIDWLEWRALKEAIPPAYTEYLGHQALSFLRNSVANCVVPCLNA